MRMRVGVIAAAAMVAGCQGYRAGSFRSLTGPFVGEVRTVGCLDVAVDADDDPQADGPAASITLGNRCDAGVVVDLGALRAQAVLLDGTRVPLRMFDPMREIRPATIEARAVARETIEFEPPPESPEDMVQWCVDIGDLDTGSRGLPVLVCFPAGVRA